jgi:uncharacterized RDD family membrane protein YckC
VPEPQQQVQADPRAAGFGIRLLALLMDWVIANVVVLAVVRSSAPFGAPITWADLLPLATFAVLKAGSTALTGASPGQLICGIAVARLDGERVGLPRAALRTLLVLLVLPAVVSGPDRRAVHDHATGTAVLWRRGERAQLPAAPKRRR